MVCRSLLKNTLSSSTSISTKSWDVSLCAEIMAIFALFSDSFSHNVPEIRFFFVLVENKQNKTFQFEVQLYTHMHFRLCGKRRHQFVTSGFRLFPLGGALTGARTKDTNTQFYGINTRCLFHEKYAHFRTKNKKKKKRRSTSCRLGSIKERKQKRMIIFGSVDAKVPRPVRRTNRTSKTSAA